MRRNSAIRPALVPALAAALALPAAAAAADDVAEGRALAERWCAECHLLPGETEGPDTGPALAGVAVGTPESESALEAWLFAPHDPMPDLDLAPAQIADIVAYLRAAGDGS